MKRKFVLFVLGMFLISMVGFVSAAESIADSVNDFVDGTVAFFEKTTIIPAILGETVEGDLLFAKLLFFAMIISIVFLALKGFPLFEDNTWALWIVSIAVSILSIRFISSDGMVQSIILPYTALGIAISAAIPFVIYFIVVEKGMPGPRHKTFRKIAWIFFIIIFIGLWFSRLEPIESNAVWIYPITVALALLVMMLDGTIQGAMAKMKADKGRSFSNRRLIDAQMDEIRDADGRYSRGQIDVGEHERRVKAAEKKLKQLSR